MPITTAAVVREMKDYFKKGGKKEGIHPSIYPIHSPTRTSSLLHPSFPLTTHSAYKMCTPNVTLLDKGWMDFSGKDANWSFSPIQNIKVGIHTYIHSLSIYILSTYVHTYNRISMI